MPSYRRGWSWTVSVLVTFGGFFLTDTLARLISGWHHPHSGFLALVFLAWLFGCVAWWISTFAHLGFVPIIRIPASASQREYERGVGNAARAEMEERVRHHKATGEWLP